MRDYQRSKLPTLPKTRPLSPAVLPVVTRKRRGRDAPDPSHPIRGVHPFVFHIWKEINAQQTSAVDVGIRAGVCESAMRKWRDGTRSPNLLLIEAVLNTLGWRIKLERIDT